MNFVKKIGIVSSLFVLSLGACSQNNSLPISNKKFVFKTFEEVSVDEGLYGGPSGLVGADKDELASTIKNGLGKTANAIIVGETPISNLKYNGTSVKTYSVNEYSNQYSFFVIKGNDDTSYRFVEQSKEDPLNCVDYIYSLGMKSGSTSRNGVITNYTYEANVAFESVTYNASDDSLLTKLKVSETSTINGESSVKSGSFNVTWKV